MKKLSKAQLDERTKYAQAIRDAQEALAEEVEKYNDAVLEAWNKVEEKLVKLNDALDNARDFRDGITADMDQYMVDRSEKWQESEAGERYTSWKGDWEDAELDDVELDRPDDLEAPTTEAADTLDNLEAEPGTGL